jgi:hypothetical protein
MDKITYLINSNILLRELFYIGICIILVGCSKEKNEIPPYSTGSTNTKILKINEIRLEYSEKAALGALTNMFVDDEYFYINDPSDGTVKVFTNAGKYIQSIGKRSGQPLVISGVTVDKRGRIYISDLSTRSIFYYSPKGKLIDSLQIDEESRFVLGIPRIFKNRLYIGVLESHYSTLDLFKSTLVGIFDKDNKKLMKRFGRFDKIYKDLSPLSPEIHFDIDKIGNIYIIEGNSPYVFCYDSNGNEIKTFGVKDENFKLPVSPMPMDLDLSRKWLSTWSNMQFIKASGNYLFISYFNRKEIVNNQYSEDFFLDIYTTDGRLIEHDFQLPGRLLFAKGDSIYIDTDLKSSKKIITIFKLILVNK